MPERWLPASDHPGEPMLRLTAFLVLLALIAVIFLTGCVYKGAKVTEGTDLSVGLSVPGTDGVASLTVLNYLSGFRVGLAQDARLELTYSCAETNDYFGIATTRVWKQVTATVEPTEKSSAAAAPSAASEGAPNGN